MSSVGVSPDEPSGNAFDPSLFEFDQRDVYEEHPFSIVMRAQIAQPVDVAHQMFFRMTLLVSHMSAHAQAESTHKAGTGRHEKEEEPRRSRTPRAECLAIRSLLYCRLRC